MYLTRQEEKMFDGEFGWAHQVSMEILARLGDLFGAIKLIPIKSAHVSGVSYKNIGDAPIDFLEALFKAGGKARVSATVNPSGFDPDYLTGRLPARYRLQQSRILDAYKRMGIKPDLTCTPYYLREPRVGWHLAWSESSASMYANSVIGAWSNREGGPSALAAALVGKTPDYGVHRAENRQPRALVKLDTVLQSDVEFGALGIHLGKALKDKIPVIDGIPSPTNENLKQLGAGLASSGMLSMFHLQWEVPPKEELETISIGGKDVREAVGCLSTASERANLIFIGCPHCSLAEIKSVARLVEGKRVTKETELWVCTSRHVKEKAKRYVDVIEGAGGHVLCDTCAIVTWIKSLGVDIMMTNSAKAAYYAPTLNGVNVTLAPLNKCIEVACNQ